MFEMFFPLSSALDDLLSGTNTGNNPFTGKNGLFSNPSGAWDQFKNGRTNEVNKEIAEENLQYQKDRNEIEDSRYEEETAYNRAWAENQRDYERALQQQIFDREDTAIERQVASLSKLGINPISQNLGGLGAGQAVSAGAPAGMSARGGTALHNDFQMQDQGLMALASPLMSLINGIDNINTAGVQRDSLREQRDGQILENQAKAIDNLIKADKNDISINSDGSVSLNRSFDKKAQDFNKVEYTDKNASSERNERENNFQKNYGVSDGTPSPVRIVTELEKRYFEPNPSEQEMIDKSPISITKKTLQKSLSTVGKALGSSAETVANLFRNLGKKKSKAKKNTYDDSYEQAIKNQLIRAGW